MLKMNGLPQVYKIPDTLFKIALKKLKSFYAMKRIQIEGNEVQITNCYLRANNCYESS